jgi:microcystin degradation protein MlrC
MQEPSRAVSVTFRLASDELGLDVGIRLCQLEGRWLAVADFGDEPEVGIGSSARTALAASLATLGARAAAALLADPELFGVSAAIRRPA